MFDKIWNFNRLASWLRKPFIVDKCYCLPPEGGAPPAPDNFCVFVSNDGVVCGEQSKVWSLVVSVRWLWAFVSSWRLSAFLKIWVLTAKHAKIIARVVRLAALWAGVRGLRGQHRGGMRL